MWKVKWVMWKVMSHRITSEVIALCLGTLKSIYSLSLSLSLYMCVNRLLWSLLTSFFSLSLFACACVRVWIDFVEVDWLFLRKNRFLWSLLTLFSLSLYISVCQQTPLKSIDFFSSSLSVCMCVCACVNRLFWSVLTFPESKSTSLKSIDSLSLSLSLHMCVNRLLWSLLTFSLSPSMFAYVCVCVWIDFIEVYWLSLYIYIYVCVCQQTPLKSIDFFYLSLSVCVCVCACVNRLLWSVLTFPKSKSTSLKSIDSLSLSLSLYMCVNRLLCSPLPFSLLCVRACICE